MSASANLLRAGQRYRITCKDRSPQIIAVHHATGEIDHVLLPFDAFNNFKSTPLPHDAEIHAEDLQIRLTRDLSWAWVRGDAHNSRIRQKSRFAAPLRYGGCIYSFERPARGAPRQSLADNRGMDLGSESMATLLASEMILDSIPPLLDADGPSPMFSGKIAIVLHLHYPELWDEFAAFFAHSKLAFRLIVTLTANARAVEAQIISQYPAAKILILDNLGRDVRPFVTVLQSGLLDEVDLVCKLHGKRSKASGVTGAHFGHLWRRRALLDLLGSPRHLQTILDRFETQQNLGMAGPATLRLRNGSGTDPGFDTSKQARQHLCEEANLNSKHIVDDFFAGTMFWVRRAALEPLRNLSLPDDQYTVENTKQGDQFEHALERFFADCTRASGYRLGDIEPLALVPSDTQIRSVTGEIIAPHSLFEAPRAMYRRCWAKPLPVDLSARKVALVTMPNLVRDLREKGWLTVLCRTFEHPQDSSADGLFLRSQGGFSLAAFADALQTAPQLWNVKVLQLVTEDETLTLQQEALQNPEIRTILNETLVWHRASETRHRTTRMLKTVLQN